MLSTLQTVNFYICRSLCLKLFCIKLSLSTEKSFFLTYMMMARQHKIGQFVPIYQGDYWLMRLRIANEEHTKIYSCMRYNEHTHATTNNSRYALLADEKPHQW